MFRQEFEMSVECKKATTMFRRFAKKHRAAWNVWGEVFEYMLENNLEHMEEEKTWSLWLYADSELGTHYMSIVLLDEGQKIE